MARLFLKTILIALLGSVCLPALAQSEDGWDDDEWGEEESHSGPDVSGFIEAAYGELSSDNVTEKNQSLEEVRGRLNLSKFFGKVFGSFKGDLISDGVSSETQVDIREPYLSFSPASSIDMRIGRQILTWGTGDLVFLNDLFPKDWQSMFAGRDMEYLKAAADSLRLTYYHDSINADFAWTPTFTPDNTITGERFSYYSPFSDNIVAAPPQSRSETPSPSLSNSELSLRLYKNINSLEYAFYGYRGFFKQPLGFNPQVAKPDYPRMNSLGASLRGPLRQGIAHLEVSYYDSVDDRSGDDPLIANSQLRFLAGYEQELLPRFTVGLQYYLEWLAKHDRLLDNSLNPDAEPEEQRHTLTLRLGYRALQDKLNMSLFSFYSPSDKDSFLLPKINYRWNDNFSGELGANIFSGSDQHTFLGQLQKNDNVYLRLRYNF